MQSVFGYLCWLLKPWIKGECSSLLSQSWTGNPCASGWCARAGSDCMNGHAETRTCPQTWHPRARGLPRLPSAQRWFVWVLSGTRPLVICLGKWRRQREKENSASPRGLIMRTCARPNYRINQSPNTEEQQQHSARERSGSGGSSSHTSEGQATALSLSALACSRALQDTRPHYYL